MSSWTHQELDNITIKSERALDIFLSLNKQTSVNRPIALSFLYYLCMLQSPLSYSCLLSLYPCGKQLLIVCLQERRAKESEDDEIEISCIITANVQGFQRWYSVPSARRLLGKDRKLMYIPKPAISGSDRSWLAICRSDKLLLRRKPLVRRTCVSIKI
jgi:hypothetical protein